MQLLFSSVKLLHAFVSYAISNTYSHTNISTKNLYLIKTRYRQACIVCFSILLQVRRRMLAFKGHATCDKKANILQLPLVKKIDQYTQEKLTEKHPRAKVGEYQVREEDASVQLINSRLFSLGTFECA